MLDKVKAVLTYIEGILLAILAGAVWFLTRRTSALQEALDKSEYEKKLQKTDEEMRKIDADATDAITNYESLKREYDSSKPPDVP